MQEEIIIDKPKILNGEELLSGDSDLSDIGKWGVGLGGVTAVAALVLISQIPGYYAEAYSKFEYIGEAASWIGAVCPPALILTGLTVAFRSYLGTTE